MKIFGGGWLGLPLALPGKKKNPLEKKWGLQKNPTPKPKKNVPCLF